MRPWGKFVLLGYPVLVLHRQRIHGEREGLGENLLELFGARVVPGVRRSVVQEWAGLAMEVRIYNMQGEVDSLEKA